MKFGKLTMQNFMSVGEEEVEIDLDAWGEEEIVRILGDNKDDSTQDGDEACNGSGKSMISEAIVFALFDRTIRGLKKDKCVNNVNKKRLRVTLEVDDMLVKRMRKPLSLELEIGGVDQTLSEVKLTQGLIESTLGMNFETFIGVVVFGQHNTFSFLTADKSGRRAIVENLLGLEAYNKYERVARDIWNALKKDITGLKSKFDQAQGRQTEKAFGLKRFKQRVATAEQEVEEALEVLRGDLVNMEGLDVVAWQKKWDEHDAEKEKITDLVKQEQQARGAALTEEDKKVPFQAKINEIQKQKAVVDKEILKAKTAKTAAEKYQTDSTLNHSAATSDVKSVLKSISDVEVEITRVEDLENGVLCPNCYKEITQDSIASTVVTLRGQISDLTVDKIRVEKVKQDCAEVLAEANEQVSAHDAKITQYDTLKDGLDTQITAQNTQITAVTARITEINALAQQILEKRGHIENMTEPEISRNTLAQTVANIDSLKAQIKQKETDAKKNPYADEMKELETSLSNITTELEAIGADLREREEELPYREFWVKGFGDQGIKAYIVEQIIPVLNDRINYWLQFLISNKIKVVFDRFLDVAITRETGEEFLYEQGSAGEHKRIDLAISLAFAHVMQLGAKLNDCNILFLDEVAESLDKPGIQGMYRTMQELAKGRTIFLITHNPHLAEMVEDAKEIVVEKSGGFSKVLIGEQV